MLQKALTLLVVTGAISLGGCNEEQIKQAEKIKAKVDKYTAQYCKYKASLEAVADIAVIFLPTIGSGYGLVKKVGTEICKGVNTSGGEKGFEDPKSLYANINGKIIPLRGEFVSKRNR